MLKFVATLSLTLKSHIIVLMVQIIFRSISS